MKFGIVTFPGSNCDYDAYQAVVEALGEEAVYLWHKDHDLQGSDVIDPARRLQLRRLSARRRDRALQPDHAGRRRAREARRAGARQSATDFRSRARPGCCPARCCATRASSSSASSCGIRVETTDTLFTNPLRARTAHASSRSPTATAATRADEETLDRLEGEGRVVFRYRRRPGDAEECVEPERLDARHRRHRQRGRQRARHDAPPGTRRRSAARLRRRTARSSSPCSRASQSDEERDMRRSARRCCSPSSLPAVLGAQSARTSVSTRA